MAAVEDVMGHSLCNFSRDFPHFQLLKHSAEVHEFLTSQTIFSLHNSKPHDDCVFVVVVFI
jgi:hypothetical protein